MCFGINKFGQIVDLGIMGQYSNQRLNQYQMGNSVLVPPFIPFTNMTGYNYSGVTQDNIFPLKMNLNSSKNNVSQNSENQQYHNAVDVTGALRKCSVGNMLRMKDMGLSMKEIVDKHEQISDECWDKLNSAKNEDGSIDEQKLSLVLDEMIQKFNKLIAEENKIIQDSNQKKSN